LGAKVVEIHFRKKGIGGGEGTNLIVEGSMSPVVLPVGEKRGSVRLQGGEEFSRKKKTKE